MEQRDKADDIKKLSELLKDIRIAMLTTVDDDGSLRSRPMATQDTDFDGTLWFFTDYDSGKSHEIEHDHHVNVSYSKPGDQVYVSVTGTARVLRDEAMTKKLWSPFHKAWFPKGPEDPNFGSASR